MECTLKTRRIMQTLVTLRWGRGAAIQSPTATHGAARGILSAATSTVPIQGGTNNPLLVCLGGYILKKGQDPSSDAPPARCRWRSPGPPRAGAGSGPLPRPGRRTTKAESGWERLRVPDRLPACALYLGLFAPSTRPLPGGLTESSIPWLPVPSPPRRVHARGLPSPRF